MEDYNKMLEDLRRNAKSMSNRELLEEVYVKLGFYIYMQNELEKAKIEYESSKAKGCSRVNFPDTSFCQIVNPMPFPFIRKDTSI